MSYTVDCFREPYTKLEKVLFGIVVAGVSLAFAFMLWYMDKDAQKLAVAMRVKFIQLFNVLILWAPLFLMDKVTPGKTIQDIMATPLDRAIFFGLMAISSSIVIAWGSV